MSGMRLRLRSASRDEPLARESRSRRTTRGRLRSMRDERAKKKAYQTLYVEQKSSGNQAQVGRRSCDLLPRFRQSRVYWRPAAYDGASNFCRLRVVAGVERGEREGYVESERGGRGSRRSRRSRTRKRARFYTSPTRTGRKETESGTLDLHGRLRSRQGCSDGRDRFEPARSRCLSLRLRVSSSTSSSISSSRRELQLSQYLVLSTPFFLPSALILIRY